MSTSFPRRTFLKTAAAGGLAVGLGDLSFLSRVPRVSAAELPSGPVRFDREIEPLVALIEETPRNRLLEEFGARVTRGLSYRHALAALMLAGVRNIQPRPVGFKFHAVLVVNSAHLASINSPDSDRWLPIFWALDHFKGSQARDVREGDWTMQGVDEPAVPPGHKARAGFIQAMESWDESAADAAAASLARNAGAQECFELFARYGARDFRDIGHKAIYVANSWRTLHTIGWQHSEPVIRSLAYALIYREGNANPAEADLAPDRPWRRNLELAAEIRDGWLAGAPDPNATAAMLDALRSGSDADACRRAVSLLNAGASSGSLFDAFFQFAGELLMKRPGIVALHAVTSTNALHYAFRQLLGDEARRLILLQNAAFLVLFRQTAFGSRPSGEPLIDVFEPEPPAAEGVDAINEIFADASRDRMQAARKALAYLKAGGEARPFIDAAQRLIYMKGRDSHDYKFSSAALEDYHHISPDLRDRFLAASLFQLRGSGAPDNALVQRTRAALGG